MINNNYIRAISSIQPLIIFAILLLHIFLYYYYYPLQHVHRYLFLTISITSFIIVAILHHFDTNKICNINNFITMSYAKLVINAINNIDIIANSNSKNMFGIRVAIISCNPTSVRYDLLLRNITCAGVVRCPPSLAPTERMRGGAMAPLSLSQ